MKNREEKKMDGEKGEIEVKRGTEIKRGKRDGKREGDI